jgi:hypothetical protein
MNARDAAGETRSAWPALPLEEWEPTYQTLHLWTQIAGKVRMQFAPLVNHWWNVPLYVNSRGLTTSFIPANGSGFELQFDFIDHQFRLTTPEGAARAIRLESKPTSAFYREAIEMLQSEGIPAAINIRPQEIPGAIPFDQDDTHAAYQPEYAARLWRILVSTQAVLDEFRGRFTGKCSPVHFFWGSFDLACTRFSGRRAPPRKGVISSEAYSHECASAGWWPGGGVVAGPAFYSYAYPEPEEYASHPVQPGSYHPQLREFILLYDDARRERSPAAAILNFFQSAYEAAATLGNWDRSALER